ncbi:cupin domain-containing protein [Halococcus salifodinae]|uniref:Cupin n=1 Tax=Halococcus salifodinae DSM 8989 TaxID=1227456 RepID=M0N8R4_9EURY|nr:cupin domain-containing protein [Halococcus salifodinae]EMA54271.1 cupin [Halococcus salifodinae DSM 8989]
MDVVSVTDEESVEALEGVHLAQLAAGERTSVQHFRIKPGAVVGEHSHEHEQTGFVTRGELTFTVDGEEVATGPGDSYVIPGGAPHAAENCGDEPVEGVEIFSPPRPNPPWTEG